MVRFALFATLILVTGCASTEERLAIAASRQVSSKPAMIPEFCVAIMQNFRPSANEPLALTLGRANVAISARNEESRACGRYLGATK